MSDFRVLFVCLGNICRSPLGERLLASKLPSDGFVVESAGVRGLVDRPMDPEAAAQLERLGGSAEGFAARQLDRAMIDAADLVLVATSELRSEVLGEWPSALRRTFTVREFAALTEQGGFWIPGGRSLQERVAWAGTHRSRSGLVDRDIPDPYRRGEEAHTAAAELMAAAVERIASALRLGA